MKLLWRVALSILKRKISIVGLKNDKIYLLVIARDADIDIDYIREQFGILELQVVIVISNYVEGIKLL